MRLPSSSPVSLPAAADCSRLVELAGRMNVPASYAIQEFIELGARDARATANTVELQPGEVQPRTTRIAAAT